MLETNKKLVTKTNRPFFVEVPSLTELKCQMMQKARRKAEAAARPGSRPAERPAHEEAAQAGRRAAKGRHPRSSQAAPAATRQAVWPQARSLGDGHRLELRSSQSLQPAPFRTARGRGRDPGVSEHHAPYTCPGPVAWATKRASAPPLTCTAVFGAACPAVRNCECDFV